jgi:hypothetical protein
MKPDINNKEKLKRKHKIVFKLNDYEADALERFCNKYRVQNRSRFIRETVMQAILERFDEDYPTLFDAKGEANIKPVSDE